MQGEQGALVLLAVLPLLPLLDALVLQCRGQIVAGSMQLAIRSDPGIAARRPARAGYQIRMTRHDCR